jgi:hypothetical protein
MSGRTRSPAEIVAAPDVPVFGAAATRRTLLLAAALAGIPLTAQSKPRKPYRDNYSNTY